ncbi:Ubiquitin carboxyl-terminal hydrolase 33 [Rhizophlyctis rosea]|nr:Ubiquitin carboxyl-terminal hydrolase 33 [Rhizophlyctis rosea]
MVPLTILDLPSELLNDVIVTYLHGPDAIRVSQTCKTFKYIGYDVVIWKHLSAHKGYDVKPENMTWKQVYFSSCRCEHLFKITSDVLRDRVKRYQEAVSDIDNLKCSRPSCNIRAPDLWLCLTKGCDSIGCGRTKAKHAYKHYHREGKTHDLALKINTLEVWCYGCREWIGGITSDPLELCKTAQIATHIRSALSSSTGYESEASLNERRQRERNAYVCTKKDTLCFVTSPWIEAWKEFLIGNGPPPGPIDNSHLVGREGKLRVNARPNLDFGFVSEANWEGLMEAYGGGPRLSENDLGKEHTLLLNLLRAWRKPHREVDDNQSDGDDASD